MCNYLDTLRHPFTHPIERWPENRYQDRQVRTLRPAREPHTVCSLFRFRQRTRNCQRQGPRLLCREPGLEPSRPPENRNVAGTYQKGRFLCHDVHDPTRGRSDRSRLGRLKQGAGIHKEDPDEISSKFGQISHQIQHTNQSAPFSTILSIPPTKVTSIRLTTKLLQPSATSCLAKAYNRRRR